MMQPGMQPVIYLFCKAPVAGRVKTRMQPGLSPQSCARLAGQMFSQTCVTLSRHWSGPRVIAADPDIGHPLFRRLGWELGFELEPQQGGDLGERMSHALSRGIARASAAAVVGADVPHISGRIVRQAEQLLQAGEEVVGPAADGGFYLLGLQTDGTSLFGGIRWGQGDVLSRLLEMARMQGRRFHRLPELRDIDRVRDLEWLAARDASYRQFLPAPTVGSHG